MVEIFFVDPASAQTNCPNGEDYSPCECYSRYYVSCENVTFAEIASVFRRTTPVDLETFNLYHSPAHDNEMIPADLLNNHRITKYFNVDCLNKDFSFRVDPQAFHSSKGTIEWINFDSCNMSRLDFQFLAGFDRLTDLNFYRLSNVGRANWASFPPLANLTKFRIAYSTGFNEWNNESINIPKMSSKLFYMYLYSNDIQDAAMDRWIDWAAQYAGNTLYQLEINENDLTQIPRQLPSLTNLRKLNLEKQKRGIPLIPSGSLVGRMSMVLVAKDNKIETIEQGAFQGYTFILYIQYTILLSLYIILKRYSETNLVATISDAIYFLSDICIKSLSLNNKFINLFHLFSA